MVAEELADAGFETVTAYSGSEALAKLSSLSVDAILTDVRMPGGDGFNLLKEIKSRNPEKPVVIFMTGYSDVSEADAYHEGAEAIFSKPIDYDALITTLRRLTAPIHERLGRRHDRFSVAADVSIEFQGVAEAKTARLLNIGRGGCFIALENTPPEVGTELRLKITFQNQNFSPIEGYALCRWRREESQGTEPPGAGLEFMQLTDESISNLVGLLKQHETKSFIPAKF